MLTFTGVLTKFVSIAMINLAFRAKERIIRSIGVETVL